MNGVWVKEKDWGVLGGCTASRHVDNPAVDMALVAQELLHSVLGRSNNLTWWRGPLGVQWRLADDDGQEIARSVTYREKKELHDSVPKTALQLAQHLVAGVPETRQ